MTQSAPAVEEFEVLFRGHYARIARIVARVRRDPARAEEIAVDVFLRCQGSGRNAGAMQYQAALRAALDELRRRSRRKRYESAFSLLLGRKEVAWPRAATLEQPGAPARASGPARRGPPSRFLLRAEDMTYASLASTRNHRPDRDRAGYPGPAL